MSTIDNNWAFDVDENIYTIVVNKARKKLNGKYPNIKFTSTDLSDDTTNFYPCVYIHPIASAETGQTMYGGELVAVVQSFQVDVYTNKSQAEAKDVMRVMADIFKGMFFNISYMPNFDNGTSTYRCIARFRRIIASGDKY